MNTLIAIALAILSCPEYFCDGAVRVQVDRDPLEAELPVILRAAYRNNCQGEDLLILLAIRKAENGRPGREFGILHPRCLAEIKNRPKDSLDIQAGWAAATIVKNRRRYEEMGFSKYQDFICFLGNRYCPTKIDPQGNINWKKNVRYWFEKFKGDPARPG